MDRTLAEGGCFRPATMSNARLFLLRSQQQLPHQSSWSRTDVPGTMAAGAGGVKQRRGSPEAAMRTA
jgi:hypothetical protein